MFGFCPFCMTDLKIEGNPVACGCPSCGAILDEDTYLWQWEHERHHLRVGTVLKDRYLLGKVKGEGGFGITYIGRDTHTGRLVAIKEYFPTRCQPQRRDDGGLYPVSQAEEMYRNGMRSFLQEAGMLAAVVNIPCVVKILDYFEANGTAYMVMEYLQGETLRQRVERQGTLPFAELMERMRPLLEDMQTMHEAAILHRDIAPDNIMLLPDGGFKLMDFGCARFMEDGKSMTVVLKPGFAPPEQYMRRGQGPFTDVYGLCATIYYCITGKVPVPSVDRLENDTLQAPSALGAQIDPEAEQVLLWGLSVQPKARPQTMRAFLDRLYPAQKPEPIPPRPNPKPHDDTAPWWTRIPKGNLPLIGIGAAVLAILLIYFVFLS